MKKLNFSAAALVAILAVGATFATKANATRSLQEGCFRAITISGTTYPINSAPAPSGLVQDVPNPVDVTELCPPETQDPCCYLVDFDANKPAGQQWTYTILQGDYQG